jgi:DNA-binding FadR family transcriptional regulator
MNKDSRLPRINADSRSDRVQRALLDLLRSGAIGAGERLPSELQLAQRFGVGRTTVREALTRLRADGVLSTKPGRGAVVESSAPLALRLEHGEDGESLDQLFELRQMVEAECAALAARRHTAADLAAIEAAYAEMARAAEQQRAAPEADLAFHRAVAAATHNPHIVALLGFVSAQLNHLLAEAWLNSARHAGGPQAAQAEHLALLQAIRSGKPAVARRAARDHLQASRARLALRLGPGGRHGQD